MNMLLRSMLTERFVHPDTLYTYIEESRLRFLSVRKKQHTNRQQLDPLATLLEPFHTYTVRENFCGFSR